MPDSEKRELDPATKLDVQDYLVKFITPPAIIVAILSFVLGFIINDEAKNQALTNAMDQITPKMIDAINSAQQASTKAQNASEEVTKSLARIQDSEKQLNSSVAFQNASDSKEELANKVAEIVRRDTEYKKSFAGAVIDHDKIDGRAYNDAFTKLIKLPRKCVLFVTALGNVVSKSASAGMGGFTISTLIDGIRVAENEQYQLMMTQLEFVATVTSATYLDKGSHNLGVEIDMLNPTANNTTQTFDIDYIVIATEPVEPTPPPTPTATPTATPAATGSTQ